MLFFLYWFSFFYWVEWVERWSNFLIVIAYRMCARYARGVRNLLHLSTLSTHFLQMAVQFFLCFCTTYNTVATDTMYQL